MGNVLVVFTAKGAERIESEGGSSSWALRPRSVRDCNYVVCTRNTDPTKVNDFGNQSAVPHGAAFLVGKICGLEETAVRNGRQRYRVLMSEVADVLVPNFWDGSRVPTRYLSIEEVATRGIDLAALKFRPLRKQSHGDEKEPGQIPVHVTLPGISIPEAKEGLALRFGVGVNEIDIVIRG